MDEKPISYLIVEDDDVQACVLEKWLKRVAMPVEIQIFTADNLEDGIRCSQQNRPNATFLDLLLPLTKGGPVVKMEDDGWKAVADQIPNFVPPVIITTGMEVTEAIKIYCIAEKGAHQVFHKPYDDSFFARLKADTKVFAGQLLREATTAEMRANHREKHGIGIERTA